MLPGVWSAPSLRTIRVEATTWAKPGSRFTKDFEEAVAYLAPGL
ncbi:MAG: hypothetical protein R3E96_10390 [Planctomycetota bacterium]